MLICIGTGFSSGLPLYILIQLVPAWLRDSGVSLSDIGLFALIQMPYTWTFLWAPLLDRFEFPIGLRRGWIFFFQLALLFSVAFLGWFNPALHTSSIALLALFVAFFSASQDIALDAYRREILSDEELGLGNSVHVQAYRLSSLVPGSLSLILADQMGWESVFIITSAFMLFGIFMTLLVGEPERDDEIKRYGMKDMIFAPLEDLLSRKGIRGLLLVVAFIVLYKLGDNMATALSTPFYIDLGFTKTEIGLVAKNAALWPAIFGGLAGGLLMIRLGINRALWIFGGVQLFSIFGFAILAYYTPTLWLLAFVVGFEYLGVGLGTAAFTAFIARETSRIFAATQFALFTAMASIPRAVTSASTGFIVDEIGWYRFFLLCTLLAIPGMLLLIWVAPWKGEELDSSRRN